MFIEPISWFQGQELHLMRPMLIACLLAHQVTAGPPEHTWKLPVAVKKLANGLTVVVSEDHHLPVVGVVTIYKVGMRFEPKGRTGFAHLFEHLMFEGTPDAPKGVLDRVIESGGGAANGSTRPDYTNYGQTVSTAAMEPVLWLEADRMKTLDFSLKNLRNQQEVVKEEIRVNVKNEPYGGFFWLDLTHNAFDKWENSHDGYGSFEDLDRASISDVEAFHQWFYGPNNAVLALAGDITPERAFALAEKYFGGIPSRPLQPVPDVYEPIATKERRIHQTDLFAKLPAIAVGWRMPVCGTSDHVPAVVLSELLLSGDASRLNQALVKGKGQMVSIKGGINWPLANPWAFRGPVLFTLWGTYHAHVRAEEVLTTLQSELDRIANEGVPGPELNRLKAGILSRYYANLEEPFDRADTLGQAQALLGDAEAINRYPAQIQAVTSADLKRVIHLYLTSANRTIIDRVPASAGAVK